MIKARVAPVLALHFANVGGARAVGLLKQDLGLGQAKAKSLSALFQTCCPWPIEADMQRTVEVSEDDRCPTHYHGVVLCGIS